MFVGLANYQYLIFIYFFTVSHKAHKMSTFFALSTLENLPSFFSIVSVRIGILQNEKVK